MPNLVEKRNTAEIVNGAPREWRDAPNRRIQLESDQSFGLRSRCGVTRLHIVPVHDVPECLGEVGLDVLVLQVESVLPHVEDQQRHDAEREIGLMVVNLEYQKLLAKAVPAERRPARPLHRCGSRGELTAELVERSEAVAQGRPRLTGGVF